MGIPDHIDEDALVAFRDDPRGDRLVAMHLERCGLCRSRLMDAVLLAGILKGVTRPSSGGSHEFDEDSIDSDFLEIALSAAAETMDFRYEESSIDDVRKPSALRRIGTSHLSAQEMSGLYEEAYMWETPRKASFKPACDHLRRCEGCFVRFLALIQKLEPNSEIVARVSKQLGSQFQRPTAKLVLLSTGNKLVLMVSKMPDIRNEEAGARYINGISDSTPGTMLSSRADQFLLSSARDRTSAPDDKGNEAFRKHLPPFMRRAAAGVRPYMSPRLKEESIRGYPDVPAAIPLNDLFWLEAAVEAAVLRLRLVTSDGAQVDEWNVAPTLDDQLQPGPVLRAENGAVEVSVASLKSFRIIQGDNSWLIDFAQYAE